MNVFGKVWPEMILLLWFIRKTGCQSQGYCGHAVPVVKVCTNDSEMSQKNVRIDTAGVPRFQIITCKCLISSSGINDAFIFASSNNTDHAWFEVNTQKVITNHKQNISDKADLIFFNTNDTVDAEGCLEVYTVNGTNFNITCNQNRLGTTTDPLRPRTSYSSSGITSVTEAGVEQEDSETESGTDVINSSSGITSVTEAGVEQEDSETESGTDVINSSSGKTSVTEAKVEEDSETESGTDIIIPIVAATVSVVCIAGVVALVVVCRRRSLADTQKSGKSTTVFEKEKEDEYYMTDNPMYDATDAEPNLQSVEREYHYIESENQDVSMPDCQYESVNDSENEPVLANKVNQNNIENEKVREQESKLTAGDTIYDRTDTDSAKRFLSVNDYDHISPVTSSTLIGIDTYNTCGEAKSKHRENETIGEHSEYHVISLR